MAWQVYECPDCRGFGCKPPSDTCPTCDGEGLVKVTEQEVAAAKAAAKRRFVELGWDKK